jgi:hypothetical protein
MDEIVKMFGDPDALKKVHKLWGEYEPKSMEEVFAKIPSPPLISFDCK